MITPTWMMPGQVPYVVDHAHIEDYLSEHREVPGKWVGKSARHLGLNGLVDPTTHINLLNGLSADGSTALVQFAAIRKDLPSGKGDQP